MEIHPPAYPLIREAFKRALTTGHGRALVHATNFDVTDFRDDILHAATTCLVYDTQCNGYCEWWLAQLCEAAGLMDAVIETPADNHWKNRQLRACLLKEFHLMEHAKALPELYSMCRFRKESGCVEAVNELILADEGNGLVFAARRIGEALLETSDCSANEWMPANFDERHGLGSANAILSEAASIDPAIRRYLQEVTAYEDRIRERSEPKALETVETVLNAIRTATKRVGWVRGWCRKASVEDRGQVANLLKGESRAVVLMNVLWCFSLQGLPVYDESLLGLIFHEDEKVRFQAAKMFSHHVEPSVRLAGLTLIRRGELGLGTDLLRLNAKAEDSEAILSSLARHFPADDDDCHRVFGNLIQLLEENEAVREPLIPFQIYEFTPCMMCRERSIEILMKWNACPQWLLDEAAYDGSDDIRKLVETGLLSGDSGNSGVR